MDKKSKIFFVVFFLLIATSIGVTYYRYMILHDYMIEGEATCDPYTESCFIYVCDPEADGECTGDPVEDTSYYKLVDRNAKNIPLCDPADESCDTSVCLEGESDCSYTLCDPETVAEGEECNDPEQYTKDNPIEEETVEGEADTEADAEAESGEENGAVDGADTKDSADATLETGENSDEVPVESDTNIVQ